ncbi:MAG: type II toxin-antitoxin system HicB family antitoxin [Rubrivivax sp.]|nr:type II toxin-antitoxin system HicB family antitoxin [Rubrivivax sp.]
MSDLLEYKGYQGTIEYSKEDDLLFGKVLHVDSLIQYDGASVPEIKTAFQGALDGYLTFCEQTGRTPNKPYSGTFNVRIGPELHRDAVMAAAKRGTKLNEFVRDAIHAMVQGEADHAATYNTFNVTIVRDGTGTIDTSNEGPTNWRTGNVTTTHVLSQRAH